MMRSYLRILIALFVAIGLYSEANSQLTMTGVGGGFGAGGFTPSCAESSNFIARTSGLSDAEKGRYDVLICGLVTDAVFSKLDALYILAAPDSTTAKLNLKSSSFGLTEVATVTFTANQGYASNGATGYLDTSFNASTAGGSYTRDSASMGGCDTANNAAYSSLAVIGADTPATNSSLFLVQNSVVAFLAINSVGRTFPAISTQQGNWIVTRTASNLSTLYRNGSSAGTDANASNPLINLNLYILATNDNGTAASFLNTNDKLSYAFIGGGLNGTEAANLTSRIHTFMLSLTVPISVCG